VEVEEDDIDREVERIADRSGESARKVRARLEKEELMEALATDLLERKALDLILAGATYEDYEWTPDDQGGEVATLAADAAPDADPPPPAADAAGR
jgi:trigger factor